jgi:hypothetical protein
MGRPWAEQMETYQAHNLEALHTTAEYISRPFVTHNRLVAPLCPEGSTQNILENNPLVG